MAYRLLYDETNVAPYLFNLALSRAARLVMTRAIREEIRDRADSYRNNPELRLAPDSDCFWADLVFRDPENKVIYHLRFVLSDAAAQYGILRAVYVDCEAGPQNQ